MTFRSFLLLCVAFTGFKQNSHSNRYLIIVYMKHECNIVATKCLSATEECMTIPTPASVSAPQGTAFSVCTLSRQAGSAPCQTISEKNQIDNAEQEDQPGKRPHTAENANNLICKTGNIIIVGNHYYCLVKSKTVSKQGTKIMVKNKILFLK